MACNEMLVMLDDKCMPARWFEMSAKAFEELLLTVLEESLSDGISWVVEGLPRDELDLEEDWEGALEDFCC